MLKRIILTIIATLLMCGSALGATYYVDSRADAGGNGTTTALTGVNCAWDILDDARLGISTGDTVNVIVGSGPYDEQMNLVNTKDNITWNFNGCEMRSVIDANALVTAGTHKWTSSGVSNYYYLEDVGGGDPNWAGQFDGSTFAQWCVIDGLWLSSTSNRTGATPDNRSHNWDWGDYDTLGFDTLYINYSSGTDPTSTGIEIFINKRKFAIRALVGVTGHVFNDVVLFGAEDELVSTREAIKFNRSVFQYSDDNGVEFFYDVTATGVGGSEINTCKFVGVGHRAVEITSGFNVIDNIKVYDSTFSGCHLMLRYSGNGGGGAGDGVKVDFKNNASYNLYAGAIQWDATAGLTEDYNQFHIECASVHGSKAIEFSSANWGTTGANSIPASTSTQGVCGTGACPDADCGTDPLMVDPENNDFHLQSNSPCLGTGVSITGLHDVTPVIDLGGDVYCVVNIGAYGITTFQNGTIEHPYDTFTDFNFADNTIRDDIIIYLKGNLGTLDLSSVDNDPDMTIKPWGNISTVTGVTPHGTPANIEIEFKSCVPTHRWYKIGRSKWK